MSKTAPSGQKILHTSQADTERRHIVQQRGGLGRKNSRNTEDYKSGVEGDYEAIVCVDARHESVGNALKGDKTLKIVRADGDVS